MRHLTLNETTPEAELGGGGEVEETTAVEPEAAVEETTPEAPQIDYDSPEFREAVSGYAAQASEAQLGQLLHMIQSQGPAEDPLVLDPFNMEPDQFTDGMKSLFGQMLDERLAPFQQMAARQQIADVDSFVSDRIEALPELPKIADLLPAPADGAEDTRQTDAATLVEMVASSFLPEAEAMHGQGQRAVDAALRAGAQVAQQQAQKLFDAGRASYKAELERIGQSVESPQGAAATATAETGKDVFATADAFFERRQTS